MECALGMNLLTVNIFNLTNFPISCSFRNFCVNNEKSRRFIIYLSLIILNVFLELILKTETFINQKNKDISRKIFKPFFSKHYTSFKYHNLFQGMMKSR